MIEGQPFSFPVRVYYEDTDAAGVVYYANYLKFIERARTEWLAAHGLPLAELEREHGIVFVVTRVEIDFHSAARLGDLLGASVAVDESGRSRFIVRQEIRRDGTKLVGARVTLACLERSTWKPARIPADVRKRLERK